MLKRLSPLQIYLLGGALALASGLAVKPFSKMAHSGVLIVCLLIYAIGIAKHFRKK